MRYPDRWKMIGVRVVYDREVYYRDAFEQRDVFVGQIASRLAPGAKSPGGMTTDTVWTATRPDGTSQDFASKTLAVESLLPQQYMR